MTKRVLLLKGYTILLILAVALLLSLPPMLHSVQASPRTIHLVGYNPSGWNNTNPQISVQPGDTVTIMLSSGDSAPHQFLLDLDGDHINDQSNCPPNSAPNDDPCSSVFMGSSTATVTFTAPSSGTFSYYCTVHYPNMIGTIMVQPAPSSDYSISSSPSSLTVAAGSSRTSTISLASQNGFSSTVSLSATVTPTGPSASFNPASVPISSGRSGTSTLTVSTTSSTPSGSFTVKVNGTSESLTHQTTVTVIVTAPAGQDFNINTNPTRVNVAPDSTATTTVTISSTNGFSGVLTLSGAVSPASMGPSVSFSPSSVTVSSGGQATSTLTVSAVGGYYSSVATGNYSVNVTATNGSLSHSTSIQVTVGSPSSTPAATGNLPLTALAISAVVIVAAVGVMVYLVRRRQVSK